MEKHMLCENKPFKLFILFKNLRKAWGGKGALLPYKQGLKTHQHGVKCTRYWYKYFS